MAKNYPTAQLDAAVNGTPFAGECVERLVELSKRGRPADEEELKRRIDQYFHFCRERNFRPGIESLCSAIGTNRKTFWRWINGSGCSAEWSSICNDARQFIGAFLEQAAITGKLNPATSIFLMKNWLGYKDTISFDDMPSAVQEKVILSVDELPSLAQPDDK